LDAVDVPHIDRSQAFDWSITILFDGVRFAADPAGAALAGS
jgi:hypothetical protein